MSRFAYRCLIALHPRAFRERFGDELLCIFDEATHAGSAAFLLDALHSLARQWFLRSGLWRWAIGASLTALLIFGCAHSEANFQRRQTMVHELIAAKAHRPLDKAEFNRQAAGAVAMLARFRRAEKKKPHPLHSPQFGAPDASQD